MIESDIMIRIGHALCLTIKMAECSIYFTVSIISLYRFIVICFPLKSKSFNSTRNIKMAIGVIWLSSFFLAMPLAKMSVVS